MKFVLKTFFPFPISRECFDSEQALLDRLEYIFDMTEAFYKERDENFYIDSEEGIIIFQVNDNLDKYEKFKDCLTKKKVATFSQSMYELRNTLTNQLSNVV